MKTTDQRARLREFVVRVGMIALSSLIVAVNLKSFVAAGDLFPGGFTGISRLIQRCALEFAGIELPFGPINLALNAIPAFISFKTRTHRHRQPAKPLIIPPKIQISSLSSVMAKAGIRSVKLFRGGILYEERGCAG